MARIEEIHRQLLAQVEKQSKTYPNHLIIGLAIIGLALLAVSLFLISRLKSRKAGHELVA